MKTIESFVAQSNHPTLTENVISWSKNDDLEMFLSDVNVVTENGAECAGVYGFIDFDETTEFYRDNRQLILARLKEDYDEFGYDSVIGMVKGFNYAKKFGMTDDEIGDALYNPESSEKYVIRLLAWYALEEVCHDAYRYFIEDED